VPFEGEFVTARRAAETVAAFTASADPTLGRASGGTLNWPGVRGTIEDIRRRFAASGVTAENQARAVRSRNVRDRTASRDMIDDGQVAAQLPTAVFRPCHSRLGLSPKVMRLRLRDRVSAFLVTLGAVRRMLRYVEAN
jgi:hypothetical protein